MPFLEKEEVGDMRLIRGEEGEKTSCAFSAVKERKEYIALFVKQEDIAVTPLWRRDER